MNKKKYFLLITIGYILNLNISLLNAEDNFLSSSEVAKMEKNAYATEEEMSAEINELYSQLDGLRQQLDSSSQKNINLNQQLETFRQKDNNSQLRTKRIKDLQNLALKSNLAHQQLKNIDYKNAYYSLSLGNIETAQLKFIEYLATSSEQFSEHQSAQSDLANKEARLKDFNTKWQLDKDKANFFLGELYLIQADYINSLKYLSDAYRFSNDYDIVIYSLLGIIESFEAEDKIQEVCLTLKSLQNAVETIQQAGVEYTLPKNFVGQLVAKRDSYACNTDNLGQTTNNSTKANNLSQSNNSATKLLPNTKSKATATPPNLNSAKTNSSKMKANNNNVAQSSSSALPANQNNTQQNANANSTNANNTLKSSKKEPSAYVSTNELYPLATRSIRSTLPVNESNSNTVNSAEKQVASAPQTPPANLEIPKIPQDAYSKLDKNHIEQNEVSSQDGQQ